MTPADWVVHPAFVMFAGAVLLPLARKRWRSALFLVFAALTLVNVCLLPFGEVFSARFLGYPLVLLYVDPLSRIFGTIFAIISFAGGIYSYHIRNAGQQAAALVYGGSAIGVTFAGDYLTLFFFWETMAVSSVYLIWARRTADSETAGMRYLLVHLFGGSALLAGVLLKINETGSSLIWPLTPDGSLSSWLILAGVGLNAAIPPLHAWLSDAYPRATATGAVFLSALTTKSAVYFLARVFPGWEILIFFGVLMALYGVVYAVLANDIREILAYHIISQVGYMVAGVGIGTEMALNGTTAHAFSHILYKALLFMGAGVVLHTTGKTRLTELGGLSRSLPLTLWLYMIGAFSISGFPLFNGFISKSMVVAAAGEAHHDTAMLLLMLASIGTFLHTGLKLPYFTWYSTDRRLKPEAVPLNMHIGMGVVAAMCILFGVAPGLLYRYLPFENRFDPYTMPHLVETVQILVFTFIAFRVLRSKLGGESTISIDTDWFYRRPARRVRLLAVDGVNKFFDRIDASVTHFSRSISRAFRNPVGSIPGLSEVLGYRKASGDFDPDLARPRIESILIFVLVIFSIIALMSLLKRL